MTPAEFLDDYISVQEDFSNVNRMVSSNLVVWHALVLARVRQIIVSRVEVLTKSHEISLRLWTRGLLIFCVKSLDSRSDNWLRVAARVTVLGVRARLFHVEVQLFFVLMILLRVLFLLLLFIF